MRKSQMPLTVQIAVTINKVLKITNSDKTIKPSAYTQVQGATIWFFLRDFLKKIVKTALCNKTFPG